MIGSSWKKGSGNKVPTLLGTSPTSQDIKTMSENGLQSRRCRASERDPKVFGQNERDQSRIITNRLE